MRNTLFTLTMTCLVAMWGFGCEAEQRSTDEPGSPPPSHEEPGSPPPKEPGS